MATINDSERQSAYDRLHRSPEIRAAAIRKLEMLAEKFPALRLGQILQNALPGDLYYVEDDALLRALSQLEITYGQFTAAKIAPKRG
jgi:hypothetical protein